MHVNIYKKEFDFRLNIFSWAIFIAFLCSTLVMQHYPSGFSFEGFLFVLPIIILIMYWSEKKAYLLKVCDSALTKKHKFQSDFFITSFSVNIGNLVSLFFQYNNSDARGIWAMFIYFGFLCSITLSLSFSMLSYILPTNKSYTFIFSFVVFTLFSISKFWPYYVVIPYVGQTNSFAVVIASLILIHFLFSSVMNTKNLKLKFKI